MEAYDGSDGRARVDLDYFSVVELSKQRRRPIFWPKWQLAASEYASHFALRSVEEYRRLVLHGGHMVCFDLAASYWQVKLPDNVAYVLEAEDGSLHRVVAMPFGADYAAEVMHIVTTTLSDEAARRSGVDVPAERRPVHIDNAGCFGDGAAEWAAQFVLVAAECEVTLNDEDSNVPQALGGFVGIRFNMATGEVNVKQVKLPADCGLFLAQATNEDLERAIGRALYYSAVLGVEMHAYYFVLKWWRRRLHALARGFASWGLSARPPASVVGLLREWFERLARNDPVRPLLPEAAAEREEVVVAVDSSGAGWAAVLLVPGAVPRVVAGRWRDEVRQTAVFSVNAAEGLAAAFGLLAFEEDLRGRHVLLLTDNTSVQHALQSRRPAASLALALTQIQVRRLSSSLRSLRVARNGRQP